MEVEHEQDVPKVFLGVKKGGEVQLKSENVDEEPPSTYGMMRVDAPESPQPRASHILSLPTALGSTSSSCHYSRLKSTNAAPSLISS